MIGCNSICTLLVGRVISLACLHTQLILFQKHLQYKSIAKTIITSADTEVPIIGNVFTFIEDQKLLGYVLSFVNVIFMLKIYIVSNPGFYELSLYQP